MNARLLDQARELSLSDQIELVEAIWDSIAQRNLVPSPTLKQAAELDRRITDLDAHPGGTTPWAAVKDEALGRIRR